MPLTATEKQRRYRQKSESLHNQHGEDDMALQTKATHTPNVVEMHNELSEIPSNQDSNGVFRCIQHRPDARMAVSDYSV